MLAFDEATNEWTKVNNVYKVVIQHLPNQIIYGYSSNDIVYVLFKDDADYCFKLPVDLKLYKGELLFSKYDGLYFSPINYSESEIFYNLHRKGNGTYPFRINQEYEAVTHFDAFKNKQQLVIPEKHYQLSDYINYTFGLEFETSQGYIPEDICYRDGLIPLRDGSITAPEYSTIVLEGNSGIALLKQQLETLKKYTNFNKECSLHVHLGNYPLTPQTIFNLYSTCKALEHELKSILPDWTFTTSNYKENGKDYCKLLRNYRNFDNMYQSLVGIEFFGDFTQAHPKDVDRRHKWNVPTRYFWCNFINALCYNVNKTIEFRFLRPTYNFKKIILWLYIFNGILKYSQDYYDPGDRVQLKYIMDKCYPSEVSKNLIEGISRISLLTINQQANGDYCGAEFWRDDELFNDLSI